MRLMFALWIFVAGAIANGAVPPLINYQGQLKDAAGLPLGGSFIVTFSVYDSPNGNVFLWSEAQNVDVTEGRFTVLLGLNVPFPGNAFSGPNRWLGIKVGTDAELSPRHRLVSTPYAFESMNSDSAGYAFAVAPNSISTENIIDGQIKNPDLAADAVTSLIILDRTVTGNDIAFNTITSAEISTGAVHDLEIFDGTVNTADLADNSVNSAKIANGTVTGSDIGLGAVGRTNISDEPGVAQALDASPAGVTLTTTTPVNILSRSLTCPASGYVLAIASCNLYMPTGVNAKADLGISQTSLTFPSDPISSPANAASNWSITFPFSIQRIYSVTAGVHTFYFVGSVHLNYDGPISAFNTMLSLVYFPTSYGTVSGAAPALDESTH